MQVTQKAKILQISQLPSWRYSGVLCTCPQQKVGFLLCCVCHESKWKGTYWISNNSLYSPQAHRTISMTFSATGLSFPLLLLLFWLFFFLILSHMKDALWEQWWGSASLFMTLWISVWVIGSESCSANYTRLMNCVITAAALHVNWMHINDSSYSNLNDVWRSDVYPDYLHFQLWESSLNNCTFTAPSKNSLTENRRCLKAWHFKHTLLKVTESGFRNLKKHTLSNYN